MREFLTADILRDVVSSIGTTLMMFVLARPKYGKKAMTALFFGACLLTCSAILFCIFSNYTTLAKSALLFYIVIGICLKPFFRGNWLKWCFNLLTTINIFASIVILSYYFSRMLPYPQYANTFLRVILFVIVIFLFVRYMRPLYQAVVDSWNIVLLLAAVIFANYVYFFISSKDIEQTMVTNFVSVLLLIVLSSVAYVTVFFFLLKTSQEYELKEENLQIQMQQKLLDSELHAYDDFIAVANQCRHDLRHHNVILSKYLSNGNVEGAQIYLKHYDDTISDSAMHRYCLNHTANVVLQVFKNRTNNSSISFAVQADIPESIPIMAPELGVLLSNVLENAFEACEKVNRYERCISLTAETDEANLRVEVRNSVVDPIEFKEGLPVTTKKDGGTGTRSIIRIIEKNGGMFRFKQEDQLFITQLVLPLK